jgi:pSer/pThr/pTyr-binding forkhead associated (FHA) protein
MPRLVLLSEGLTGKTYELKGERTTVGRIADNTVEIAEPSISSHHCELILQDKDVLVRDLGSTNGTFINGEKITEATLKTGQILRLGMIEMRLESGEPVAKSSRDVLDHTRVIPQGVKLDELQGTRAPLNLEDNKAFGKKSNKGIKIFIGLAVVVGICLIVLLIVIAIKGTGTSPS